MYVCVYALLARLSATCYLLCMTSCGIFAQNQINKQHLLSPPPSPLQFSDSWHENESNRNSSSMRETLRLYEQAKKCQK